jgi:serine/threonine protein phosphatase PrpC
VDVAIRGDRASCLTMQLGPRTWFFALARGFGSVDGMPVERALLSRLRAECERRLRSDRFRRAVDRPHAAATAVLAALSRVNGDLYVRAAAHDDYVTAAASFTAALIVRGRAYVMHAGGTAAYLAHRGDVVALSGDDLFEDSDMPLLGRTLATTPNLDVAVSSVALDPGDVIVLVGHRVPGDIDRRTLIAHVESTDSKEHVLVVRFENDDAAGADADEEEEAPRFALRFDRTLIETIVVRVAAGIAFALALALAH